MSYDYSPRTPDTLSGFLKMNRYLRYIRARLALSVDAVPPAVREHWAAKVQMMEQAKKLYRQRARAA